MHKPRAEAAATGPLASELSDAENRDVIGFV